MSGVDEFKRVLEAKLQEFKQIKEKYAADPEASEMLEDLQKNIEAMYHTQLEIYRLMTEDCDEEEEEEEEDI